ncbi:hypothetical protein [Ammoniphilus sp. YIM 78166]|nr:hypothetical protein [Ammoniphilus sp. YIM 78166]
MELYQVREQTPGDREQLPLFREYIRNFVIIRSRTRAIGSRNRPGK